MQTVRRSIWPLVAALSLSLLTFDVLGGSGTAAAPTTAAPYGNLRIQYLPDPNDIVNLAEGTPYTVPAGKVLIITDWVTTDVQSLPWSSGNTAYIQPSFYLDGVKVWGGGFAMSRTVSGTTGAMASTGASTLTGSLRSGIRAGAGSTVTLETIVTMSPSTPTGTPTTFASGYLAKAH